MPIPTTRLPMRAEPWQSSERQVCPVCGGTWRPWVGSRLPCHARCLFDDENLGYFLEIAARPKVAIAELARHQGISLATARAIIRYGTERRA